MWQTELCPHWEAGGCSFGAKCKFAHGAWELTLPTEHRSFKTQLCKNFWAISKGTTQVRDSAPTPTDQ